MMGVAAGLAKEGYRPVVYTITPFTTTRCLEQIKLDVCYHGLPVTIVGVGAGLSYAGLGPTHHSFEDLAILRPLPGITLMAPCDAVETRVLLREAVNLNGPCYMRIGKKNEPVVHGETPALVVGRGHELRAGSDVIILCAGTLMPSALAAADLLQERGVACGVVSMHTVKPLDEELVVRSLAEAELVVTLEEHGLIGGFGAAVAEFMVDRGIKGNLLRLGIADQFVCRSGNQGNARKCLGLDSESIAASIFTKLVAR
jgi:transketolase